MPPQQSEVNPRECAWCYHESETIMSAHTGPFCHTAFQTFTQRGVAEAGSQLLTEESMSSTRMKNAFAWGVIKTYRVVDRRRTAHHMLNRIFWLFGGGGSFPVEIGYRNPLRMEQRIRLALDLAQNVDLWLFRARGHYERGHMQWLLAQIRAHGVRRVLDVGANLGIWSLLLAQAEPGAMIDAYEPLTENWEALTRQVAINELAGQIRAHHLAIGDRAQWARLWRNPYNNGGGSLSRQYVLACTQSVATYQQRHPAEPIVEDVPMQTLDTLITRPCVVKIDVESAELMVLAGARQAIEHGLIRALVMEVQARHREDVEQALRTRFQWTWEGGPRVFTIRAVALASQKEGACG